MARVDFDFVLDEKEWAKFLALAKELPAEIGQKAFRQSIHEGLNKVRGSMEGTIDAKTENPTGNLRASLRKKINKKYEPNFWHGSVAVKVGKKRADGAYYWHMVEYGHRIVGPTKRDTGMRVPAMRFAIGAFEANKDRIKSDFAIRARQRLERAVKKLKRQGKL